MNPRTAFAAYRFSGPLPYHLGTAPYTPLPGIVAGWWLCPQAGCAVDGFTVCHLPHRSRRLASMALSCWIRPAFADGTSTSYHRPLIGLEPMPYAYFGALFSHLNYKGTCTAEPPQPRGAFVRTHSHFLSTLSCPAYLGLVSDTVHKLPPPPIGSAG